MKDLDLFAIQRLSSTFFGCFVIDGSKKIDYASQTLGFCNLNIDTRYLYVCGVKKRRHTLNVLSYPYTILDLVLFWFFFKTDSAKEFQFE